MPVGERVAVIGGGNTAIDAVTQARRLGAQDAAIVYRRTQSDMSAYEFEQELAKIDGARFLFNVVPVEIVSQGRPCERPQAGPHHQRERQGPDSAGHGIH